MVKTSRFMPDGISLVSRVAMSGVNLPAVNELMGHQDINMMWRHTHLSAEREQHGVSRREPSEAHVPSIFPAGSTRPPTSSSQAVDFPSLPR